MNPWTTIGELRNDRRRMAERSFDTAFQVQVETQDEILAEINARIRTNGSIEGMVMA